ncbi:MAG: VWA domain-containing protein [Patescibacteria group bacterium]
MNLYLERQLFLLVIPLGLGLVWFLLRQRGRVGYSQLQLLEGVRAVPLGLVQKVVLTAAVVFFGVSLAQPMQYTVNTVPVYVQARDIVVCLDTSGSMMDGPAFGASTKINQAKKVIGQFIAARPQDRIALVTFSDQAYLDWPLTLDHAALLNKLVQIKTTGGTQIGRGMIVSLEQLALFGHGNGAVIIVSDGISSLKPEEKEVILQLMEQTQPRLYWILAGDPNPSLAVEFRRYIEGLGGTFYQTTPQELKQVFDEISELEASPAVYEQEVTVQVRFGPLLAILAGILVLASLIDITKEEV